MVYSTDTKKVPTGQKPTEADLNEEKRTEGDINGHKQTETDRIRENRTEQAETNRTVLTLIEKDSNGQKQRKTNRTKLLITVPPLANSTQSQKKANFILMAPLPLIGFKAI